MQRVRITQPGYENFTGEMGHIEFKDGVSVHTINDDFVRSLSTVVRVEVASDIPQTDPAVLEGSHHAEAEAAAAAAAEKAREEHARAAALDAEAAEADRAAREADAAARDAQNKAKETP